MWIFEDLEELFKVLLHMTIVGLHFTELHEAKIITIGVIVGAAYMVSSFFEAKKASKEIIEHHKKSQAEAHPAPQVAHSVKHLKLHKTHKKVS